MIANHTLKSANNVFQMELVSTLGPDGAVGRLAVTLSVGAPPMSLLIAYRRAVGLIVQGVFTAPSKVLLSLT